jgi:hypothetical protein
MKIRAVAFQFRGREASVRPNMHTGARKNEKGNRKWISVLRSIMVPRLRVG